MYNAQNHSRSLKLTKLIVYRFNPVSHISNSSYVFSTPDNFMYYLVYIKSETSVNDLNLEHQFHRTDRNQALHLT